MKRNDQSNDNRRGILRFGILASCLAAFAYGWMNQAGYWLQGPVSKVTTTVLTAAYRMSGGN